MSTVKLFNEFWVPWGGSNSYLDLQDDEGPGTHTTNDFNYPLPEQTDLEIFSWLEPFNPDLESPDTITRSVDLRDMALNLKRIKGQLTRRGTQLPQPFISFITNIELANRVPSCKGCFLDLPQRALQDFFVRGDHIIRFLSDSQYCVCWYLYLPPNTQPFVLASTGAFDRLTLDDVGEDAPPLIKYEAQRSSLKTSQSFSKFIYRFWMENMLWYHRYHKLPLSQKQLTFVRHCRPNFVDPYAA